MAATRKRKSTKSAETLDREVAQEKTLLAQLADLKSDVRKLAEKVIDLTEENVRLLEACRRKEKLLSIYQRKAKQPGGNGLSRDVGSVRSRLEAAAEKSGITISQLSYRAGTIYHGRQALL